MEKVSVRNLVEFILRTGDIKEYSGGVRDAEVMHTGTRIHKMIQKSKGYGYIPEVPMDIEYDTEYDKEPVTIKVEGRADGIIEGEGFVTINEIKSMLRDVTKLTEAEYLHVAQAKCYGAIYVMKHDVDKCNIQITYCQMETMLMNEFEEEYTAGELKKWFHELVTEYAKWVVFRMRWQNIRDASIKKMKFPFEYRKGQFDLVKNVYFTILRKKNIFVQAPTGTGKTISTIFPSVSAVGEKLLDKIIYLTAKTITRTVAEETVKILADSGVMLKCVTITAKDKICILPKAECSPEKCMRAKGHYDRVNDAVYDLLTNEQNISRKLIEEYAEKYSVCPYEMCLDATNWSDMVICDYNYVFDPNVYLKRFFADEDKNDYILLIDEAHNLIERARNMYSVELDMGLVRDVKKSVKIIAPKLYKALESVNRAMLAYKRQCDEFSVFDSVGALVIKIMNVVTAYDDFLRDILKEHPDYANRENMFQLYFDMRYFLVISEVLDDKYRICGSYTDRGEFVITLKCMDPSGMIGEYLAKIRSAVFFSATLLPVKYYMQQLGAADDDYAVYAESSFDPARQLILAATDVSARYSRRTKEEYAKIAGYIESFISARKGNYIVFFPSYKMLGEVCGFMEEKNGTVYVMQHENMTESEKEEFLENFTAEDGVTKVGLCVLGGVFGEGIDLQDDRLIGAVIVGTGLPMVGDERELFKYYYDEVNGKGFEYAYLYPGMNKVLQAAGRVIRTASDKGCILLLDDRFAAGQYRSLFPREWKNMHYIRYNEMSDALKDFWSKED